MRVIAPVHPANALPLQLWVLGYVVGFVYGVLTGTELMVGFLYAGYMSLVFLTAGLGVVALFGIHEGVPVVGGDR